MYRTKNKNHSFLPSATSVPTGSYICGIRRTIHGKETCRQSCSGDGSIEGNRRGDREASGGGGSRGGRKLFLQQRGRRPRGRRDYKERRQGHCCSGQRGKAAGRDASLR